MKEIIIHSDDRIMSQYNRLQPNKMLISSIAYRPYNWSTFCITFIGTMLYLASVASLFPHQLLFPICIWTNWETEKKMKSNY